MTSRRPIPHVLLASIVLLALPGGAEAELVGRVMDPDGSSVADAPVRLRDQAAGIDLRTRTNEDGRYEFALYRWPRHENKPLEAGTARIKVGEVGKEMIVTPDATHATFTLDLKHGPASLQTWLEGGKSKSRGAYFVWVKRINE